MRIWIVEERHLPDGEWNPIEMHDSDAEAKDAVLVCREDDEGHYYFDFRVRAYVPEEE